MRELKMIGLLSVLVVAFAAVKVAIGQQQQAQPLTIEKVKDGLFVVVGSGGNVGVRVTNEGVVLIDDKFQQNYAEIVERVKSVTTQPVKYVLGTHHHGDHMGGNPEFIKTAEIIAHRNVRENMIKGNQPAPPRIVFTDRTAVFLGGVEVQAHHLGRGHTNGDSVIYFPDLRTIHTGDLFVGSTPFIDYANGGSSTEWVTTLDNILKLDFDTAIPGHGPVMKKDDVRAFQQKFRTLRQRMTELIRSGVTKDEMASKLKTDDLNWPLQPTGNFVQRSLGPMYDELAGGR